MKVVKNMTIEESVVKRVQAYADNAGLSLSAAFSVLATQKLDELEALRQMPVLSDVISKAMLMNEETLNALMKPGQAG